MTLEMCHKKYPDGCSTSSRPGYDAYLDFLKDQDPGPNLAPTADLAEMDFRQKESALPRGLTKTNHARFANQFATQGEGNIYSVVAYLYFVGDTSKSTPPCHTSVSETSNCRLTAPDTFDYHLGLGFDSALADRSRTHPKPCDATYSELEKNSVVVEMTPYTRHPKWTVDRVNSFQGQQVKVVGQLMVDNDHFNKNDDCHYPIGPDQRRCWRSTVWEIHPVTQFYVCNNKQGCSTSSPDTYWTNLDDEP
jgi:hypothetical protein